MCWLYPACMWESFQGFFSSFLSVDLLETIWTHGEDVIGGDFIVGICVHFGTEFIGDAGCGDV